MKPCLCLIRSVQLIGMPPVSMVATPQPCAAHLFAADTPAIPAPITIRSYCGSSPGLQSWEHTHIGVIVAGWLLVRRRRTAAGLEPGGAGCW